MVVQGQEAVVEEGRVVVGEGQEARVKETRNGGRGSDKVMVPTTNVRCTLVLPQHPSFPALVAKLLTGRTYGSSKKYGLKEKGLSLHVPFLPLLPFPQCLSLIHI